MLLLISWRNFGKKQYFRSISARLRKQHTRLLKVLRGSIEALDSKKYCVARLQMCLEPADQPYIILAHSNMQLVGLQMIQQIEHSVPWLKLPLPSWRSTKAPRFSFGVHFIFIFSINNLCHNLSNAKYHFYADGTIIYCCSTSRVPGLEFLQAAFNVIQSRLFVLELVLIGSVLLPQNITSEITSRSNVFGFYIRRGAFIYSTCK